MSFPAQRLRRLRENPRLREWVGEHRLDVKQLVQPLFVKEGLIKPAPISSMPGQFQWPLDALPGEVSRIAQLGIPAVLLFGIPSAKDLSGNQALSKNGILQRSIKKIKQKHKDLLIIAVCKTSSACGIFALSVLDTVPCGGCYLGW